MTKLEVFDPSMCCPSGVCGPSVDPVLARFAADVEWLKGRGVAVERHGLAQEPGTFATHPVVRTELADHGLECLPLVLLDGKVIAEGEYPSRERLENLIKADGALEGTGAADSLE